MLNPTFSWLAPLKRRWLQTELLNYFPQELIGLIEDFCRSSDEDDKLQKFAAWDKRRNEQRTFEEKQKAWNNTSCRIASQRPCQAQIFAILSGGPMGTETWGFFESTAQAHCDKHKDCHLACERNQSMQRSLPGDWDDYTKDKVFLEDGFSSSTLVCIPTVLEMQRLDNMRKVSVYCKKKVYKNSIYIGC